MIGKTLGHYEISTPLGRVVAIKKVKEQHSERFKQEASNMALHPVTIEKTFTDCVMDLKEVLVLDGIDTLEDPAGFRIRAHDLYGPLPDILIKDTGDRHPVLERITNEAAELIAMVRVRHDLAGMFRGCEFLLPTSTEEGALVGMRFRGRTILAEENSHWEAYHRLMREAVRIML